MKKYNYRRFKPEIYDFTQFPGPKAGEKFIDTSLFDKNGNPVKISTLLDRPLVIETGSITCPIYAKCVPKMNELSEKYKNLNFIVIYVREAHPGNKTSAHTDIGDKIMRAAQSESYHNDKRTTLVDTIDGVFHKSYGSMPNMVYIIDTDGVVLFRGDWNNPDKVEEVIKSINKKEIFREERFEPTKPTFLSAMRALSKGGYIAFWDLIVSLPKLMKKHRNK